MRIRQRLKQQRVQNAEHRSVDAKAEGEREHGHGGEAGILQQLAQGEFDVVHLNFVSGQLSVVRGRWSVVGGEWSVVAKACAA